MRVSPQEHVRRPWRIQEDVQPVAKEPLRVPFTRTVSYPEARAKTLPPPRPHVPTTILRESHNAGAFYCEHVYFTAQKAMGAQPKVGFLHVPTDTTAPGYSAYDRMVAAALRGYVDILSPTAAKPTRILLTGFEPFGGRARNVTGDFVTSTARIDAAMRRAYGDRLLSVREAAGDATLRVRQYVIQNAAGVPCIVIVSAALLPVSDAALDPRNVRSVPARIIALQPDATLHMGENGNIDTLNVELRATNADLRDGKNVDGAASEILPDNPFLQNAVDAGYDALFSASAGA